MKIYISMPVSAQNHEYCRERAERAKALVESKGHKAVTPFDVCPDPGLTYAQYIARDIEALLQCDGIFLLTNWSRSSGCQIEWHAAEIFHKRIFHHISEIPDEAAR